MQRCWFKLLVLAASSKSFVYFWHQVSNFWGVEKSWKLILLIQVVRLLQDRWQINKYLISQNIKTQDFKFLQLWYRCDKQFFSYCSYSLLKLSYLVGRLGASKHNTLFHRSTVMLHSNLSMILVPTWFQSSKESFWCSKFESYWFIN